MARFAPFVCAIWLQLTSASAEPAPAAIGASHADPDRRGMSKPPSPEPRAESDPRAAPNEDVSATQRALAPLVAIVPGVLVHGSGSYVLSDTDTFERLILLEGAGIGLTLGGLSGLALTGAARSLAAPFIVITASGVALFGLTLLVDVYHVLSPADGFGRARSAPWFESRIGYLYVNDPQFEYRHFVSQGLSFWPGRFGFGFEGWYAPEQRHSRLRLSPRYRLIGAVAGEPATDGSHLDFVFVGGRQDFDAEHFVVRTHEVLLEQRLDVERILPNVRGAFTDFQLGVAFRETRFEAFGTNSFDSLLLLGFGLGAYLGDGPASGGEVSIYYDHRHDDFAAGATLPGLGSGVPGHVGARLDYYFSEHLGFDLMAEVGSAWVVGAGLRARVERRRRPRARESTP